jgi:hypothetical protein
MTLATGKRVALQTITISLFGACSLVEEARAPGSNHLGVQRW